METKSKAVAWTCERNSAIELLRIIAAIGVIVLHYNKADSGGGFKYVADNTVNQQYLRFSETLFICAVNLFVMISAYFLSGTQKRKLSKAAELFFQMEVFKALFYIRSLEQGKPFSIVNMVVSLLPGNYFVVFYLVLYVISPYINILIKNISKVNFKRLVVMLFLIFSVWNFFVDFIGRPFSAPKGLSTISIGGTGGGYTIVNFILVYFVGAFLRLNEIKLNKKASLVGLTACLAILHIEAVLEFMWYGSTVSWNYDHPLVILIPVFAILLFNNFKIESGIINSIAKASFTSYLFHSVLLKYIMVEKFVNRNIFILIAHQFGMAILIYMLSYLVYKMYYLITTPIFKRIAPIIDKCDISVSD